MLSDQFYYWLLGYFELRAETAPLTPKQVDCVLRHAGIDPKQHPSKHEPVLTAANALVLVIRAAASDRQHELGALALAVEADDISAECAATLFYKIRT